MALLISIFLIKEPVFFNIALLITQALIVSLYFFFFFRFTLKATHQIKFSCIQNETKTGKFEVIPLLVALKIKVWAAFFQNIFFKNAMMGLVISMFTVQGSRCHFD